MWFLQHFFQRRSSPDLDAPCAYLLIAIVKQRKHLSASMYEILQVVSVSSLEQIPLDQLFVKFNTREDSVDTPKQLEINYS